MYLALYLVPEEPQLLKEMLQGNFQNLAQYFAFYSDTIKKHFILTSIKFYLLVRIVEEPSMKRALKLMKRHAPKRMRGLAKRKRKKLFKKKQ